MEPDKTPPVVEVEMPRLKELPTYTRSSEPAVWLAISLFLSGVFLAMALISGRGLLQPSVVLETSIIAALPLLFALVFRQIFAAFPFEYIRGRLKGGLRYHSLKPTGTPAVTGEDRSLDIPNDEISAKVLKNEATALRSTSPPELFASYVLRSRHLADSIYSRSGVYLLVGVVVAFSGLLFFYTQTANLSILSAGTEDTYRFQHLLTLAPKFGILFFIEIVAFFFLRQYRSAMDEFRYYEAIKRKREETLALLILAEKSTRPVDIAELLKIDTFFSSAGKLSAGESSEIIESRKLEKNELDLLEKVVEVLSRSKK